MHKITLPTTLRPVQIARLLEREGSPLAPLAEEIYDLALFYRIDAAFALAQCMVESKLGCTLEAQANRSAALVPLAVARMAAPTGPLHYGDEFGTGYVAYPSWLTGLEEYFRILRLIFVDAWREERVEDVARAFLASAPNRRGPARTPPKAWQGALTTRSPEVIAYARRVERYRHQFQTEASAAQAPRLMISQTVPSGRRK
jgi:hypothetical protein